MSGTLHSGQPDIREICASIVRDMFELSEDEAIDEEGLQLDALDIQSLIDEINERIEVPVCIDPHRKAGCTLGEFYRSVEEELAKLKEGVLA